MKQQSKKLFYISKKLASNDFKQIIQGLIQSRLFVSQVKILDLLNTIIMSLLDLFNTAKFSYIKAQAAQIISSCKHFISKLHSKPEIISTLSKCLKSSDVLIRILAMELVIELNQLFLKDTSVYHLMCSRLKWREQMSFKQQLRTVQCLRCLLEHSEYLSQMFSNNILELNDLGGIQGKIIVYLCAYAKFESSTCPTIISLVWQICSQQINTRKIILHYFIKLIMKCCKKNYQCIQQYYKSYSKILPNLQPHIIDIQNIQYNFMISTSEQYKKMSDQKLLDICNQYMYISNQIPIDIQKQVENRVIYNLENGKELIIMMTFYVGGNVKNQFNVQNVFIQHYSPIIAKRNQKNNIKLLKIALTTANFKLANSIIEHCMNSRLCMWRYSNALVLLESYVLLHINNDTQSLLVFLTVMGNLSIEAKQPYLLSLSKIWLQLYQQQLAKLKNQQQFSYINDYLFSEEQSVTWKETKTKSQEQNKLQFELLENKYIKCEQQINDIKSNGILLVPKCLSQMQYGKIYLTKRTIIDILKFL